MRGGDGYILYETRNNLEGEILVEFKFISVNLLINHAI